MQKSRQNSVFQPHKLAKKQGEVEYHWPVKSFKRLSESLLTQEGLVNVHIKGSYDDVKRCLLETSITADLRLECQTSFTEVAYSVDKKVTYCVLVAETEFAELEDPLEPVLLDDGFLDLKQLIEDELILSLPLVVNKKPEDLAFSLSFGELTEGHTEAEAKEAKSPFAVLAGLKKSES
jgi:uncharacterized protein